MKTMTALVGCILFTLLFALFPLGHSAENPRGIAEPDPVIISKLRDLITIRERQVEMHNVLAGSGRLSGPPSAAIALAEARIELAREVDQQEDVGHKPPCASPSQGHSGTRAVTLQNDYWKPVMR
jgi:hypothetical protein